MTAATIAMLSGIGILTLVTYVIPELVQWRARKPRGPKS